uniref:FkbM family methyltransferase n=1 Tax=Ignisphaera aggregans TaxID=334771 RepID=A0A7J3YU13_9CREN
MIKRGLVGRILRKMIMTKVGSLLSVIKNVENWQDLLCVKYGLKSKADIRFRNLPLILREITAEKSHVPFYFAKKLSLGGKLTENKLEYEGLTFLLYNPEIDVPYLYSIFVEGEYDKFSFHNKVVLDISAYIGDTSIFFAVKGAKRVYAYEPNPEIFNILVKNIELNHLQDRILPKNLAVGKDGYVDLLVSSYAPGSTLYIKRFDLKNEEILRKVNVKSVSINTILSEVNSVDILKMDCEGCEHVVLRDMVNSGLADKVREGLILEVHFFERNQTIDEILNLMRLMGFRSINVRRVSGITSFVWAYKGK